MRQVVVRYKVKPERDLAVTEAESEGSRLSKLRAFQEFQKHIEDRTDECPVVTEPDQIGSFRLVGDSREH
jgi:hypothetical protein